MQQVHRTERYLERIRQIYEGVPHHHDSAEYYADDVLSFFIHCHHIHDWMLETHGQRVSKGELQAFINSSLELQICADLCNAGKHGTLLRQRSGDVPVVRKGSWIIMTFRAESKKPVTFKNRYEIQHGGQTYDALELAEKCVELWRGKIRELALEAI